MCHMIVFVNLSPMALISFYIFWLKTLVCQGRSTGQGAFTIGARLEAIKKS